MTKEELLHTLLAGEEGYHGMLYRGRTEGQWYDGGRQVFVVEPLVGDTVEVPENGYANSFVWVWMFLGRMDGSIYLFEYQKAT